MQAMNANEKVDVKDRRILNFRIRCVWASQLTVYFFIHLLYLFIHLFTYSFTMPLV